ncbi:MAG: hypothetical protein ABFS05_13820 [Bacteroidota bacterium]
MNFKKINMLLAVLFLLSISCKKGSVEIDYNPNLLAANNQVVAERAYSEVFNIFFMVVTDPELKTLGSKDIFGAHCTYQENPEIKYIIDFLSYYTTCPDDKIRKGVITATLDMDFSEVSATASLTFEDYAVEKLRLEGENTILNNGLSASMLQIYEHHVPSATLTFVDTTGEYPFSWESQKSFTYLEGMITPDDYTDDMFHITGESSGADIFGTAFSTIIEEPLGDYFNCSWIRTGKTTFNTPGLEVKTGYIKYIGDDSCTSQVMYFFNDNPFYDEFMIQ